MTKIEQIFQKIETNISQTLPSINSKNKSDALNNNVVMINIENNTRNVPICITTIQKSVPTSTSTTSTKNNKIIGNETEKLSTSSITSITMNTVSCWFDWSWSKNYYKEKISIGNTNTYAGTDTNGNIINLVDTPAKPKKLFS